MVRVDVRGALPVIGGASVAALVFGALGIASVDLLQLHAEYWLWMAGGMTVFEMAASLRSGRPRSYALGVCFLSAFPAAVVAETDGSTVLYGVAFIGAVSLLVVLTALREALARRFPTRVFVVDPDTP